MSSIQEGRTLSEQACHIVCPHYTSINCVARSELFRRTLLPVYLPRSLLDLISKGVKEH